MGSFCGYTREVDRMMTRKELITSLYNLIRQQDEISKLGQPSSDETRVLIAKRDRIISDIVRQFDTLREKMT